MQGPAPVSTQEQLDLEARIAALNERYEDRPARELMRIVCTELFPDRVAILSSFGAEAAALLHLAAEVSAAAPVIFLDTRKHFDETVAYVSSLAETLGLGAVLHAYPNKDQLAADDPDGALHAKNADLCCHIRKTLPMMRALRPFDAFFTGRKRHQTSDRQTMRVFERYGRWVRVNPLAQWTEEEIDAYIERHRLPRHPLVARSYLSIGCAPCTRAVAPESDPRSGRWSGSDKTECGIHLEDGVFKRGGAQ